ncbi:hypothetical protein [Virgibacillus dakarensis]|uniref:hypothetical protein n=1 Tax=Virgibacillus dakarensis TaxID=1917889 RepID=UPI00190E6A1E|nr:hypothetical protein [Virgibacillus dakarensis]
MNILKYHDRIYLTISYHKGDYMTNKPKSFEDFFYSKTQNICTVEEISDYANKHNGNYEPYDGFMFCPECQKAELFFVQKTSKRRAHLKRKPSTQHPDNCSYKYEYAPKQHIKQYVDSLTPKQVQDRLNSILNILCKNKKKEETAFKQEKTSTQPKEHPMLIPDTTRKKHLLKSLRRKRLAGWIDESDGTDLHVFYGKVKLKVEEREKINSKGEKYYYYNLIIKTMNQKGEWKFRTKIYRGKIQDNINENKVYQIAVIGNLNFDWKWMQIDLINKYALQFQEIDY